MIEVTSTHEPSSRVVGLGFTAFASTSAFELGFRGWQGLLLPASQTGHSLIFPTPSRTRYALTENHYGNPKP